MTCEQCGTPTPLDLLDAKPERLAGARNTGDQLRQALDRNEDCDRLECAACYGPGFASGATGLR